MREPLKSCVPLFLIIIFSAATQTSETRKRGHWESGDWERVSRKGDPGNGIDDDVHSRANDAGDAGDRGILPETGTALRIRPSRGHVLRTDVDRIVVVIILRVVPPGKRVVVRVVTVLELLGAVPR